MSLTTNFYLGLTLPPISINNKNIAWIENVGHNLIKSVTIEIGGIGTRYNNKKVEEHNDLKVFLINKQYEKIFDLLNVMEYKSFDKSNKECEICCNEMTNKEHILKINCDHIFCAECILAWHIEYGKESCPKCRQNITTFSKCKTMDA